jgi:hypothetical protein
MAIFWPKKPENKKGPNKKFAKRLILVGREGIEPSTY